MLNGAISKVEYDFGEMLFFVTNPNDTIQRCHAQGKVYEIEDLEEISEFINPNGVILDIGANVGNHSIFWSKQFPKAKIVPFEMYDEVIEILKVNVALNDCKNIDTSFLGWALGDRFALCDVESRHVDNKGLVRAIISESGTVPVRPCDYFVQTLGVSFIKIDVEGMELQVLNGLSRTIARCRPVMFVEVDNRNLDRFDSWLVENKYQEMFKIKRYETNENRLVVPF